MTMAEIFTKFSRSDGGLFYVWCLSALWCRITSARAEYFERMLEMCGLIDDKASQLMVMKSKEAVQRTLTAIKTFADPFAITDKDRLYNITFGAPVSPEVEIDVLRAERKPRRLSSVIASRIGRPKKPSLNPQWRPLIKTVKVTSSQGKLIQSCEQSNLAFMLLIKSQLLEEPLNSCGTPSPLFLPVSAPLMVSSPKLTKLPCYTFCWLIPPKRQQMLSTSRMVWVSCMCSPIYLRHLPSATGLYGIQEELHIFN